MRSVSTMADSVMMSGLVFSFVVMFGKDRTALRVREDPFGGRVETWFLSDLFGFGCFVFKIGI